MGPIGGRDARILESGGVAMARWKSAVAVLAVVVVVGVWVGGAFSQQGGGGRGRGGWEETVVGHRAQAALEGVADEDQPARQQHAGKLTAGHQNRHR